MKINKVLFKITTLYVVIFFVLFTALYLMMPFSFNNYFLIAFLDIIFSTILLFISNCIIFIKAKKEKKSIKDCDTIYFLCKRFNIFIFFINILIPYIIAIIFKDRTSRILSLIAMYGTSIFYIFSKNYFKNILEYSEENFRPNTISLANISNFPKDIPVNTNLIIEILPLILTSLLIGLSLVPLNIGGTIYIICLAIISVLSVIYISFDFYNNLNDLTNTNKNYNSDFTNLAYQINATKQVYDDYINNLKNIQNIELERQKLSSIEIIRRTVDAKDTYTRGHSDRVSAYSVLIGEKLNLTDEELQILKIGGLFHDIGKIGIPDRVLLKDGKLTDEEYDEIKKHPEIGAHILENSDIFKSMIPIVLHHHEKYNGSGYPTKLKANEIPLMARIVAVADTFDAMTSKRVYRNSLPLDVVKEELKKFSGIQFDPKIANTFLDILNNEYEKIEEIMKL